MVHVRDPDQQYFSSKSNLSKSLKIDSETQMYLYSSSLSASMDGDFSLGDMSMELSSVLAAPCSHGVPWVTRTNMVVVAPQGCTLGPAGPEPSGTFIHPRQHLHGSTGYLNVVPPGPTTSLGPGGTQLEGVGIPEVTILLPLCRATETL